MTPTFSRFDDAYKTGTAPWVIGEPQPAVVELEETGVLRGVILDVGCGAGEHTILLTRLGRFEVADAMSLPTEPGYDTTTYRGVIGEAHVEAFNRPVGSLVDVPAYLARARRL